MHELSYRNNHILYFSLYPQLNETLYSRFDENIRAVKRLREVLETDFANDLYKDYNQGHTECCNASGDSFEYNPVFKKKVLVGVFH